MKKRGTLDAPSLVENSVSLETEASQDVGEKASVKKKKASKKEVMKSVKEASPQSAHGESASPKASAPKTSPKKSVKKTASRTRSKAVTHLTMVGDTETLTRVPIHKNIRDRVHMSASLYAVVSQLDHGVVAHNVARYAGTFFVAVGALFTLYNFNTLVTVLAQSDIFVREDHVATTCASGAVCSDSGIVPQTTSVEFRIDGNSGALEGSVPLSVTYPGAKHVSAYAYQVDSGTYFDIGSFNLVNNNVWKREWDTEDLDDGIYRIKVTISTETGTALTYSHPEAVTIQNIDPDILPPTPSDDPVDDEVSTTTENETPDEVPDLTESEEEVVTIKLASREYAKQKIEIGVYAPQAQSVRVYIDEPERSDDLLGYATFNGDARWTYLFDARERNLGEYSVRAEVRYADGSMQSDKEKFMIVESVPATATSTEVEEEVSLIPDEEEDLFNPPITLVLPTSKTAAGQIDVFANTKDASFVELYGTSVTSKVERFLGLFTRVDSSTWRLRWDTRDTPNGTYTLTVKARHPYGDSRSGGSTVTVENKIERELTKEEVDAIDELDDVGSEIEMQLNAPESEDEVVLEESRDISEMVSASTSPSDVAEEADSLEADFEDLFKASIKKLLHEYAGALRRQASEEIVIYRSELDSAVLVFLASYSGPYGEDTQSELMKVVQNETERIERRELIARERIGDTVLTDSDGDSITDFDEVNLYKTNPYVADTDGDGFLDGVEILGGFDPLNQSGEVNVLYESPRESVLPPDETLRVESIASLDSADETEDSGKERAVITGRGLPLSYVTLHIYSTPIVVTVRTDENGFFEYVFDKELEDGTHEVYATLTDNRGTIVAQSEPFSFIKTAEAFSPVGAEVETPVVTTSAPPSMLTPTVMLAIASLSVVSLGLVLILLGLHIDSRQKRVLQNA